MRILGIDPGYAILGYGVIETTGSHIAAIDCGVVETHSTTPYPERLEMLYNGMRTLIEKFKPDEVAFEELFFQRNVTTAMKVSAARGVCILASQLMALPLYEYTPMQVKRAVTGNGHADKKQVQAMVKTLLSLKAVPKPDDAADALAIALTHGFMAQYPSKEENRITNG